MSSRSVAVISDLGDETGKRAQRRAHPFQVSTSHSPQFSPQSSWSRPGSSVSNICRSKRRPGCAKKPPAARSRMAKPPPPPPKGDTLYAIERIVGHRNSPAGELMFMVKWEGYPDSQNTWEPQSQIPEKMAQVYLAIVRAEAESSSTESSSTDDTDRWDGDDNSADSDDKPIFMHRTSADVLRRPRSGPPSKRAKTGGIMARTRAVISTVPKQLGLEANRTGGQQRNQIGPIQQVTRRQTNVTLGCTAVSGSRIARAGPMAVRNHCKSDFNVDHSSSSDSDEFVAGRMASSSLPTHATATKLQPLKRRSRPSHEQPISPPELPRHPSPRSFAPEIETEAESVPGKAEPELVQIAPGSPKFKELATAFTVAKVDSSNYQVINAAPAHSILSSLSQSPSHRRGVIVARLCGFEIDQVFTSSAFWA